MQNSEYVIQSGVYSDILYRMVINTPFNTWIHSQIKGSIILFRNQSIKDLQFYLCDNLSFYSIDLNGLNFSFSFDLLEIQLPVRIPKKTFFQKSRELITQNPNMNKDNVVTNNKE